MANKPGFDRRQDQRSPHTYELTPPLLTKALQYFARKVEEDGCRLQERQHPIGEARSRLSAGLTAMYELSSRSQTGGSAFGGLPQGNLSPRLCWLTLGSSSFEYQRPRRVHWGIRRSAWLHGQGISTIREITWETTLPAPSGLCHLLKTASEASCPRTVAARPIAGPLERSPPELVKKHIRWNQSASAGVGSQLSMPSATSLRLQLKGRPASNKSPNISSRWNMDWHTATSYYSSGLRAKKDGRCVVPSPRRAANRHHGGHGKRTHYSTGPSDRKARERRTATRIFVVIASSP
ncbi:hypothetical protein BDV96DRAFT_662279 [Lophiotrema nucula]|uniref:Uncharacterized protein n=1 Tax=Lophiotrema nucula TaxID=690887 RepID=A0A6A5Z2J1_9PLEO|nr:hypothetical protein BDV96DRAFT_662279 [Lophiotrema nucula]